MCKWRRFFWSCGHAEFLLLEYCDNARPLPVVYLEQALGIEAPKHESAAQATAGNSSNEQPNQYVMADPQPCTPSRSTSKTIHKVETSTMQTKYEGYGCREDGSTDTTQHKDRNNSLLGLRSILACVKPDFDAPDGRPSLRRHSNVDLSELDNLVEQVDAMKQELARLQKQAQQEEMLQKTSSSKAQTPQRSDFVAKQQTKKKSDDAGSQGEQAAAPEVQATPPIPTHDLDQPNPPNTRRTSYADMLTEGRSSTSQEVKAAHEALAAVTGQSSQMPRYTQPTQAATRRMGETLRKQTVHDKTYPPSIACRTMNTSPKASRLPKRTELPGNWISPASDKTVKSPAENKDDNLISPVWQKRSPTYMSPTKATKQREIETLQSSQREAKPSSKKKDCLEFEQEADRPVLKQESQRQTESKQVEHPEEWPVLGSKSRPGFEVQQSKQDKGKAAVKQSSPKTKVQPASDKVEKPGQPYKSRTEKMLEEKWPDTFRWALNEVNTRTRKALEDKTAGLKEAVDNSTTRRRTSNCDILAPIFRKLNRKGLLKDDSVLLETDRGEPSGAHGPMFSPPARHREKSYADVLRRSTDDSWPALRGQTSADIGRAIAKRHASDNDSMPALRGRGFTNVDQAFAQAQASDGKTADNLPAMRGQTSAEIGRLIAQAQAMCEDSLQAGRDDGPTTTSQALAQAQASVSQTTKIDAVPSRRFGSNIHPPVIIPSGSSTAPTVQYESLDRVLDSPLQEERTLQEKDVDVSTSDRPGAVTSRTPSAALSTIVSCHSERRSLSVDAVQRASPEPLSSASSKLNAMATAFTPKLDDGQVDATVVSSTPIKPAPAAQWATTDDVFKVIPYEEWSSMGKDEKARIRSRRKEKLREYLSPLEWRKSQTISSWIDQYRSQADAGIGSPSPLRSMWSPEQERKGWKVSAANGGPSWSGGKGRELRFHRDGPEAERYQDTQFTYSNRGSGITTVVNDPLALTQKDWAANLDTINRLLASMQRGYSKVPCMAYDVGPQPFHVLPVPCTTCCGSSSEWY